MKPSFTILLFYKYVDIENPQELMGQLRLLCERLEIKGRILLAKEGINGTIEGLTEATETFIAEMKKDARFSDVNFKKSAGTGGAFPKLIVKVRKEIVTLGADVKAGPGTTAGKYLKAEELRKWFEEKKDFVIVDMRNDYEHTSGHFEGSILPKIGNFRELPQAVAELSPYKEKTVVAVCTGGIRCERGSALLVANGFKDVYQLHDGIVTYMEKYPGKDFKGSLYVFDERVTMHFNDAKSHQVIGKCALCGTASELYVNCALETCHRHFIACADCQGAQGGKTVCGEACAAGMKKE